MKKYKRLPDGKYLCLRCEAQGKLKVIESRNGFMPHSAWHRRQKNKKSQQAKIDVRKGHFICATQNKLIAFTDKKQSREK